MIYGVIIGANVRHCAVLISKRIFFCILHLIKMPQNVLPESESMSAYLESATNSNTSKKYVDFGNENTRLEIIYCCISHYIFHLN